MIIKMINILVLEDDKQLNNSVCKFLTKKGFELTGCLNANDAYDKLYEKNFDLIVSDVMMENVDGFEFAENVRSTNKEIPILFMTGLDDMESKSRGFKTGVDDYLVKPFEFEELYLRINALLRRAKISTTQMLTVGNVTMDAEAHTVKIGNDEILLTAREFNLLFKLLSYPNKAFTRTRLMDEFWGVETGSGSRTVDVYITKIREKFKGCGSFEIQTVHGLGYKAVVK